MGKVRIAVLSDLHAIPIDNTISPVPSYLVVDNPSGIARADPMESLGLLISDQQLEADFVICCGDMTNAAHPAGTSYAWRCLHKIANDLGEAKLLTVSGNHDLDSRQLWNKYDARGQLMNLSPRYPVPGEAEANKYWAQNYVIMDTDLCRILLVNTAAYHGHGDEWKHGRVSEATVDRIRTELQSLPRKRLNILVCHHHPIKFDDLDLDDYSEIKGTGPLLQMLSSGEVGRWMIFHGHRHWPNLLYSQGGGASPIVFSAGSFSAVLYPELQSRARNQFYIVEYDLDLFTYDGCDIVGTFRAWNWSKNIGWIPADKSSGLPHVGGFGNRDGGDAVAYQIFSLFEESGKPFLNWSDLVAERPRLQYVLPSDMHRCKEVLRAQYGLKVLDPDGVFEQVGRP